MLYRTKAEEAHVHSMAPRLRRADIEEIAAYSGMSPLEGLSYSRTASHLCYTVMDAGLPVAMYGGSPVGHGMANVWMLATDELANNTVQFLRQSKPHLDELHKELNSSFFYAFSDPRNTLHQVWLKYTGFRSGEIIKVQGHPFITVTRLTCV